jgi:hypothetical protein
MEEGNCLILATERERDKEREIKRETYQIFLKATLSANIVATWLTASEISVFWSGKLFAFGHLHFLMTRLFSCLTTLNNIM